MRIPVDGGRREPLTLVLDASTRDEAEAEARETHRQIDDALRQERAEASHDGSAGPGVQ